MQFTNNESISISRYSTILWQWQYPSQHFDQTKYRFKFGEHWWLGGYSFRKLWCINKPDEGIVEWFTDVITYINIELFLLFLKKKTAKVYDYPITSMNISNIELTFRSFWYNFTEKKNLFLECLKEIFQYNIFSLIY